MTKHIARSARAGLFLLCLVVGVVVWLSAKPLVEMLASRAIGHPVVIAGELHLYLFPHPGLSATDVAVAAPDWSARANMLNVERLTIALDPGALLQGRVVLDEVALTAPVLFVERTARGRVNWAAGAAASLPQSPQLPLVRRLVVNGGQVLYFGHGQGRLEAGIRHALWRKQRDGPATLRADGSIDGAPWSLQLTLGAAVPSGDGRAYPLALRVEAARFQASAEGRLGWPLAAAATDLQLRVAASGLPWRGRDPAAGAPPRPIVLDAHLRGRGQQWQLSDLALRAGANALQGRLALDASGPVPALSGSLTLSAADDQLMAELARAWEVRRAGGAALDRLFARLRQVEARLTLAVAPQVARRAGIQVLRMNLVLKAGVLTIDPLLLRTAQGALHATLRLDTRASPVHGSLLVVFEDLPLAPFASAPVSGLLRDGRVQGRLKLAFTGKRISQAEAKLHYRAGPDTVVHLALHTGEPGKPAMHLSARGRVRGAALRLEASGDPLALLPQRGVAPFALEGRLGATRIEAKGRVAAPGDRLVASVALSGPGSAALGRLLDLDLPALPGYAASAQLVLEDGGLAVDEARVRIGRSRFRGAGSIDDLSDPRHFRLTLRADKLVLSDFQALRKLAFAGQGDAPSPGVLGRLDGRVDLRAEQVLLGRGASARNVRVDASLHDGRLALRTLSADLGGGSITAQGSVAGLGAGVHGQLDVRIRALRLGQALHSPDLRRRFPGTLDGQLTLSFGQSAEGSTRSSLRYRAPASGSDIRISLRQTPTELRFALDGRYRHEAFRLHGSAAPLHRLFDDARYPFSLEFMALATQGGIKGSLRHPLRFDGLDASLTVSGPNPRRAEPLLGLRLPELPPYRLKGRLVRQHGAWTFGPFRGSVGNTDLSGRVVARFPGDRPQVAATLHSRLLDLDDLGGLVGGVPGTGPSDVASSEQRRASADMRRRARILPNADFELDELGRMDATVDYVAERVDTDVLPISKLRLRLSLSAGRLVLSPVKAVVAGGSFTGHLRLAAGPGERPAAGHIELAIADVRLGPVLRELGAGAVGSGRLHGYAAFDTSGASVAAILSSLDGGLRLSLEEGATLDALLVELAGLDLGEAVRHWLGDAGRYPVRCALIQASARNGILDLHGSSLDTSDTRFTMAGKVNFPDEKIALRIEAHPKDPSLFAARSPLLIEGPFRNPDFHPSWSALAGRAAAAGALALVAPPAAVLAFVEPGLGNSVPCATPGR